MLSFIPDFNLNEPDDCLLAEINSDEFKIDRDAARGEFIFLLDRSESMGWYGGDRIKMAKEALISFLKSLPSQCFFNIVSFGSNYKAMYS